MDPLETLLSNWTPRRPSPGLKGRVFGHGTVAAGTDLRSWLQLMPPAFAAAALLMAVAVHPGRLESAIRPEGHWTNLAFAIPHQGATAQCLQNTLPLARFTWTNAALAPSTNASVGGL